MPLAQTSVVMRTRLKEKKHRFSVVLVKGHLETLRACQELLQNSDIIFYKRYKSFFTKA